MSKALKRLKGVMARANPMNGVLKIAAGQLPKLVAHLEDLNRPESEGGQLKEGQDRITYLITTHDDQLVLSLVPIRKDEQGQMIIEKPLRNMGLEDLFKATSNEPDQDSAETGENA